MRDYSALSRVELEERLSLAEDVALVYAWCPSHSTGTDREKALHELWLRWYDYVGEKFSRSRNHPHLSDKELKVLARKRDETRRRTLAALTGQA